MKDSVRVFPANERSRTTTAQTEGMQREELVATAQGWAGMVRMAPGAVSGWHHHGEYDSFIHMVSGGARLEYGPAGRQSCVAGPGDVVFVPKWVIHREVTVGPEGSVAFVVRAGGGDPVTNVDGPPE